MNRDERIVVVGAGLTGLRAAERLRELKFDGEIIILGDERLPPYHRPALSKQLLMGALRPSDLTLPAYEDIGAKWRFGTGVRYLLPRNRTLQLPGGEEVTYDGLIIATGVEARRPNNLPYHDPRVLVLRTMPDAMDLERVINSTKGRVAVVGGGFTGCEIACSLRHMSREVTLIGRGENLLGNVLGPELGAWLTKLHGDHGVDLALGNSVQDWAPQAEGIGLRLTDGSTMLASCVIVAAGTVPTTGWLRGSGLPLDNGVVCDPSCHVVGADDIVAAGDVAQWPNLRFDNEPRRVEHWLNAIEMGRAAAESLMAGRATAEPFTPMPRFWTEQFGVRIQAAGMPKLGKDIISLGTPDEGTGRVYGYSNEGRLMGVVGLDCPSSVLAWTESVSRQNPVPRQRAIAAAHAPKEITAGPSSQEPVAEAPKPEYGKRRNSGKHQLPVKGKPHQQVVARREEIRQHNIGYVDQQAPAPTAMETSGPVRQVDGEVTGQPHISGPLPAISGPVRSAPPGWGRPVQMSGPVPPVPAMPPGRPKNAVDSFSRMLPVAVQPPGRTGANRPPAVPQSNYYGPGGAQQRPQIPSGGPGRSEQIAPAGRHPRPGQQPPPRDNSMPPFRPPTFGGPTGQRGDGTPTPPPRSPVTPPTFGNHESGHGARQTPPRRADEVRPPTFARDNSADRAGAPARGDARPPAFRAPESGSRYEVSNPTDQLHRPARPPVQQARHQQPEPEPVSGRLEPTDVRPVELTSQMPPVVDEAPYVRKQDPYVQQDPYVRQDPHVRQDPYGQRDPEVSFERLPPVRLGSADRDANNMELRVVRPGAPRHGQPERRPRHGRPEDYEYDRGYEPPRQRPGPEDSYDRMPVGGRPVRSGGRRRA